MFDSQLHFNEPMTADAAGIVACLVALNKLAWFTREARIIKLFHGLRAWALEHPESQKILAAID